MDSMDSFLFPLNFSSFLCIYFLFLFFFLRILYFENLFDQTKLVDLLL